ncbi:hypothetical protein CSA37_01165 [Candidatus Fermentibacteria bacterium]|nr:MAG: hypothetical protein CSA37_01165 [Candidatus Fermentibacteria bacterium]
MMNCRKALLLQLLIIAACSSQNAPESEPIPVMVKVLDTEMISEIIYAPCRLQAGEEAVISVPAPAKIEEVHVSSGDTVEAGARLISLGTDDMRAAEVLSAAAAVTAARAAEEYSSSNLDRSARLFEENALSPSDYEAAQAAASAAAATVRQAQAGYTAALASFGRNCVRAPFSGTIGRVLATRGNPASGPLLSIYSSEVLEAELLVSPVHALSLREGLPVIFQTEYFPGRIFSGSLISVSRSADPVSGLVSMAAQINDTTGSLVPGLSGMALILTRTSENAVVLSESFMIPLDDQYSWQVVLYEDGRAHITEVRTGIVSGTDHEIIHGLSSGDTVITLGSKLLSEGEEVRAVNL